MGSTAAFRRDDLEAIYRSQSRRIFASLVRLLGDFDLAEEALHDAFIAASEQWPRDGIPANPRAWLISVGRFRAIDRLRRNARFDAAQAEIADTLYAPPSEADDSLPDDRGAGRPVSTSGTRRRGARVLREGAYPCPARSGAPVPRPPPRRG